MARMIYKIEKVSGGEADYAVRYSEDREQEFAKMKGGDEFRTNFDKNTMGYEVYLSGKEVTKKEYEDF